MQFTFRPAPDLHDSAVTQFLYFIHKATNCARLPRNRMLYTKIGGASIFLSDSEFEAMNDLDFYILDNPDKFK